MLHEPLASSPSGDRRSLRRTATLTALALGAALSLCLLLPNLASQKISPWRAALPTAAMSADQAKTALARAGYLHEAAVRPLLVRAGLYDPEEAKRELAPRGTVGNSLGYASMLWAFRDFPTVYDKLLALLLDTGLPAPLRSERFYLLVSGLSNAADALAKEKGDWSSLNSYFSTDYLRKTAYFTRNPALKTHNATASAEALAIYRQKLDLAREFLPLLQSDLEQAMAATTAKRAASGSTAETDGGSARRLIEDATPYARYAGEALVTIWAQRNDPTFRPLAFELLRTPGASAAERYPAVSLLAQTPGLPRAEYLAWAPYRSDLNDIKACVGENPRSFAYLIGCCDKLGDLLRASMKKRGVMLTSAGSGPGITLRKVDAPPLTPSPEQGALFLLADMRQAFKDAPSYDFSRAYPLLADTPLRRLENQPLILPLKPGNGGDEALLRWYADKGWQQGRAVLLSSKADPKNLAAHLATLQLMWWPRQDKDGAEKEQMAYMHYQNGAFLTGFLPHLKGEAAARFLGPVTGIWFGVKEVESDHWYAAAPEAPVTLPLPGLPTLLLAPDARQDLRTQYRLREWVELARALLAESPVPAQTPAQAVNFVSRTERELYQWGFKSVAERKIAIGYLWRFRADPEATAKLRAIFSDKAVTQGAQKLRDARKALGIPDAK